MKPMNTLAFGMCLLLTPTACAWAQASDAKLEALEKRLEQMERRHQEDLRILREQIESLKAAANLHDAATGSAVDAASGQPATSREDSRASALLNALNPAVTVFGNFTGRLDSDGVVNEKGDSVDDRFNLREIELEFRSAIDAWADGVLMVALESESPGEYDIGVEEGYATLKRLPGVDAAPLGLRLTAGRFRPEFGRMNQIHTHDLPQTTRPRSLITFLGEEGYVENGIRAEVYLPTPGDNNSLAASMAVLNGGSIAVGEDNDGENLAYNGHLEWFWDLAAGHDLELGSSIWAGKSDAAGDLDSRLYGADFTYKWKPYRQGEWRSFLLGGELYVAELDEAGGGSSTPLGYYLWTQYQLNRNNYLGVRYDFTEQLDDEDAQTKSYAAFWSYYTTEFLRLRLGYEYSESDVEELDELGTAWLELNFVFGSHPVEPYWVNR